MLLDFQLASWLWLLEVKVPPWSYESVNTKGSIKGLTSLLVDIISFTLTLHSWIEGSCPEHASISKKLPSDYEVFLL